MSLLQDNLGLLAHTWDRGAQIAQGVTAQIAETARQQQQLAEQKRAALVDEGLRQNASDRADTAQQMNVLERGQPLGPGDTQMRPAPAGLGNVMIAPPADVPTPVDPGRIVQSGDTRAYIPTQAEATDAELKAKVKQADAMKPYTHIRVSDEMAKLAGLDDPEIPYQALGHVRDMAADTLSRANPAAAKEDPIHYTQATNDESGDVTVTGYRGGKRISQDVQPGAGKRRREVVAGGGGGGDRQMTPGQQAIERRANENELNQFQNQEDSLNQMRRSLGTAITGGKLVVDKDGKISLASTDPDVAKADISDMKARFQSVTDSLKRVVADKNKTIARQGGTITVPTEHVHEALDQGTRTVLGDDAVPKTAPVAAAPVKPAAAGGKKSASLDRVKAYAKANNLTLPQAIKAAQREGFQIGHQ